LAPEEWDYYALEDVPYHGRRVAVVWDRTGRRYKTLGLGPGLHIVVDGVRITSAPKLQRLSAPLVPRLTPNDQPAHPGRSPRRLINYAVNNDGTYYPRVTASYINAKTPLESESDGN